MGTWAAGDVPAAAIGRSPEGFTDQTVRDVVHISVGGSEIRVRISNVFGTRPLRIDDVRVALSATGARTVADSSHRVTFGGQDRVTIPIGEREFSDAVRMRVGFGQDGPGSTGTCSPRPASGSSSSGSGPTTSASAQI